MLDSVWRPEPGFGENGSADVAFARIAWIVDPGQNALAILERRQ
ncbi:MAG TPA: hypothetical protein VKA85_08235 [Candidatus Limnocylindrales bacterium]|nr:hypothetical protein [Candidatus Limnocylindrales bacterium]